MMFYRSVGGVRVPVKNRVTMILCLFFQLSFLTSSRISLLGELHHIIRLGRPTLHRFEFSC